MQALKQEPIYLPDVETTPGHYSNLIWTSQSTGRESWNICISLPSARR
jgi:hypothetical protein